VTTRAETFLPLEVLVAIGAAVIVQASFSVLLVAAGAADTRIVAKEEAKLEEEPIAVKPVLDDIGPMMKLGGKKKVRAKLPDMWQKLAPIPQENFEEASAPSEKAEDDPEAIPSSAVATGDAQAPPPDAEVTDGAALLTDAGPQQEAGSPNESEVVGEGSADGVKEGTTTDPLQANWAKTYKVKILSWFNARFRPPVGEVPCEVLKTLTASASATVSPGRTVTGYTLTQPSGNAVFDARARNALDGMVGQQLPPPPPLCTTCAVPSVVSVTFSGRNTQCK
jgi:hypothetical protein